MFSRRSHIFHPRRLLVMSMFVTSVFSLAIAPLFPTTVRAASFTVTKTADTNDGVCNSDCSLREAIIAANADPDRDIITLPAGIYTLSISGKNENAAATGDLDILGDVTIMGLEQETAVIDANRIDRAFEIITGHITMSGLTLRNGLVVNDNNAIPWGGYGGGIYSHSSARFDMRDSTIESNDAAAGGGILSGNGLMTLQEVTVRNNISGYGGGIALLRTTAVLTNTTVSDNFSRGSSGGIDVDRARLTATNTTISGNRANTVAGAIRGFDTSSHMVLNNSTIAQNHANNDNTNDDGYSGAIVKDGFLTLNNTIVAQNYEGSGTSRNSNRVGTFEGNNNVIGPDARLAPLADNGGTTLTHALLPGSPALDSGNNATCAPTDQRGVPRPQPFAGICDIGAFEYTTDPTQEFTTFLPLVFTSNSVRVHPRVVLIPLANSD